MVLNCADDTKLLKVAKTKSEEITESPYKTSKTANDLHDIDKCNEISMGWILTVYRKKKPKKQIKKPALARKDSCFFTLEKELRVI